MSAPILASHLFDSRGQRRPIREGSPTTGRRVAASPYPWKCRCVPSVLTLNVAGSFIGSPGLAPDGCVEGASRSLGVGGARSPCR